MGRIYLAIKYHPDQQNRELIERLTAVLADLGWDTYCVVRDLENWGAISFPPRELMQLSLQALAASDAVLVELSEKGVGLGIEAGYAFAKGIPVITIARGDRPLSTTLTGISIAAGRYENEAELQAFLRRALPC